MPKFKLTIASTVYENTEAISIKNMRPENNISTLEFVINDYKNRNYTKNEQKTKTHSEKHSTKT